MSAYPPFHHETRPAVKLVGCGIGDPELLTLKAYGAMQRADVVLHDHLVTDAILALIPPHVERICVGKQKGHHSLPQQQINALMVRLATEGKQIVRLKCGDPFVFGRGYEEAEWLAKQGIPSEVIPGISSAVAAPASAGIPVTSRGYASGFSVVSAHLQGGTFAPDWISLLLREHHTTVVLMGLSVAPQIREQALAMGVNPALPAAVIGNASRSDQVCFTGTLQTLDTLAAQAASPAVLVFGAVAALPDPRALLTPWTAVV